MGGMEGWGDVCVFPGAREERGAIEPISWSRSKEISRVRRYYYSVRRGRATGIGVGGDFCGEGKSKTNVIIISLHKVGEVRTERTSVRLSNTSLFSLSFNLHMVYPVLKGRK